jgi:hypothetical protein
MSGDIMEAGGGILGRTDPQHHVDEIAFRKFVDFVVRIRENTWTEVDPIERDGVVMTVLRAVGHDASGLVAKNLRGNYFDQDGSRTGETYPINTVCPLTVTSQAVADPCAGNPRIEDDYGATCWLNEAVRVILREKDADSALGSLVELVVKSVPLEPILLTSFGDRLLETRRTENHVRDTDVIWMNSVRHDRCNGIIEMHPCSEAWRTLACRKCGLRLRVPSSITTFGELRVNTHHLILA